MHLKRVKRMELVLASGNRGKLGEFRELLEHEIRSMSELCPDIEIEESADTFAGNALIKARAVYERVGEGYIVISDDSGISVPRLGGEPGIFSARYAGEGADDRENLLHLISKLRERGIERTPAYYTAAIAIKSSLGEYVVHGWMHGDVIAQIRGDGGFGYDPCFIPEGYEKSLGELEKSVKSEISHRAMALGLAKPILKMLERVRT
jgi:XTP/dITP diphosphohydrolase